MTRVLIAGESWTTTSSHVKGFDSFTIARSGAGKAGTSAPGRLRRAYAGRVAYDETQDDAAPRLASRHPVVDGLPEEWPALLGYQRLGGRGEVLATVNGGPLLVVGEAGEGRTLAYAPDIGAHCARPAFLAWDGYARLWDQAVRWLSGRC